MGFIISISQYSVDYKGTATSPINLPNLGGGVNNATGPTQIELDVMDFMYKRDLFSPNLIAASMGIGFVIQVKNIDGTIMVGTESEEFGVPIPMAGLSLDLGFLAGFIEARAIYATIGAVTDARADLSISPFPFVGIHAGYRSFEIDEEIDDFEFKFDTSGPYAAISVGF